MYTQTIKTVLLLVGLCGFFQQQDSSKDGETKTQRCGLTLLPDESEAPLQFVDVFYWRMMPAIYEQIQVFPLEDEEDNNLKYIRHTAVSEP